MVASGCATTYHPKTWTGGYTDFRISKDTFSVTFKANAYTPKEDVVKYALRRASELTLMKGFTHFVVLGESDDSKSFMYHTSTGSASAYSYGNYAKVYGSSTGYSIPIKKPRITLQIKCFKSEYPEGAIDAKEFLDYNVPEIK